MKRANPAAVGAFVLGGLALAVTGLVFFGTTRIFADTDRYVIYFDGSVNGLQLGSPVKLEGVEVGRVASIKAVVDTNQKAFYTETVVEVDRTRFERRGPALNPSERLRYIIDAGLRARLDLQSLVTGQLYVALIPLPNTEVRLVNRPDAPYPELPTVPSTSQEIQNTIRTALEKIEKMPIDEIVTNLAGAIAGIDRIVGELDLEAIVANLNQTLAETRGAAADARRLMGSVDAQVGQVSQSAATTLDRAGELLSDAGTTVSADSPLLYQLSSTLQEVSEAARAVRVLADYLEQNPNSVVFGRVESGP